MTSQFLLNFHCKDRKVFVFSHHNKTRFMSGNITFTMIKPDAEAEGHKSAKIGKIAEAGFHIKAIKITQLTDPYPKKLASLIFSELSLQRYETFSYFRTTKK